MKNKRKNRWRWARRLGLPLAFLLSFGAAFLYANFAQAQLPPADPFAEQEQKWVDLETFAARRAAEKAAEPSPQAAPVSPPRPTAEQEKPPVGSVSPPPLPVAGALPASLAPMPSTEDVDRAFLGKAGGWEKIGEAGEFRPEKEAEPEGGIRFAGLPSSAVKAIPDVRISRPALDRQKGKPKKEEAAALVKKKEEEQQAACEALSDLRRRQLEAAESDRQTLNALKQALSDLGLQDRLRFMSEGSGTTQVRVDTSHFDAMATQGEKAP